MHVHLQAGVPIGTHIAQIEHGVALLRCPNHWEAHLSLSPAKVPAHPGLSGVGKPAALPASAVQTKEQLALSEPHQHSLDVRKGTKVGCAAPTI